VEIIGFVVAILALDVTAYLFGSDSRDWQRSPTATAR
jgi:hypothetical protein